MRRSGQLSKDGRSNLLEIDTWHTYVVDNPSTQSFARDSSGWTGSLYGLLVPRILTYLIHHLRTTGQLQSLVGANNLGPHITLANLWRCRHGSIHKSRST